MTTPQLILASASPRRAALLEQIGLAFDTVPADVDETPQQGESAETLATRLAVSKTATIAQAQPDAVVLGADTVVALGDAVFGKPRDKADAIQMLETLSGRTHRVCTGLAVAFGGRCETRLSVTQVTFMTLDRATIADYWASGEPLGKAGAYAIQGLAGAFVTHLDGSYSSVMGLPVHDAAALLALAGVSLKAFPAV